MDHIRSLLELPLLTLGTVTITPGTIVISVLIVVLAFIVGGWVSRGVVRVVASRGAADGVQFALAKMIRYSLLAFGVVVAFTSIGIDLTALLAASTVVLVGIGFGLQNIAQNFISGVILLIEQPVRKGDFIKVGDAFGRVDDIGLRATTVITREEVMIVVPNSELVTSQVINHSLPTPNFRIRVDVPVAYGTDPALVKATLLAVAVASEAVLQEPLAEVRFDAFGESSLDFSLRTWISDPRLDTQTCSDLRFDIDRAFRDAGIKIPFPQRVVHLAATPSPTLQPGAPAADVVDQGVGGEAAGASSTAATFDSGTPSVSNKNA